MTDDALFESLRAPAQSYQYSAPNPALLERFSNPAHMLQQLELKITAPEFTSLCPITGQPDYATIEVTYGPAKWCLESKSFKLYLMGYRMHGAFHENVVATIAQDLYDLLNPVWLTVCGKFTPRGGIPFHPTVSMGSKPPGSSMGVRTNEGY